MFPAKRRLMKWTRTEQVTANWKKRRETLQGREQATAGYNESVSEIRDLLCRVYSARSSTGSCWFPPYAITTLSLSRFERASLRKSDSKNGAFGRCALSAISTTRTLRTSANTREFDRRTRTRMHIHVYPGTFWSDREKPRNIFPERDSPAIRGWSFGAYVAVPRQLCTSIVCAQLARLCFPYRSFGSPIRRSYTCTLTAF